MDRNDVYTITSNWFVNCCPLVARTARVPVSTTTFQMVGIGGGPVNQYCEEWRQEVQLETARWERSRTPFDPARMSALQSLMGDMETSSYYGTGSPPDQHGKGAKQRGLRSLATHLVTAPENADSYKLSDFIRDTTARVKDDGGDPDVILLAPSFMKAFEIWGIAVQRVDAGVNMFGTPIDVFEAAALRGVSLVEAPLLRPFTAVTLSSFGVRMRMRHNEHWSQALGPHGGWLADGAVEVDDPRYFGWLEGVRAFCSG